MNSFEKKLRFQNNRKTHLGVFPPNFFTTFQHYNLSTTSWLLKYLPRFALFGGKAEPYFIGGIEIG